MLTLPLLLFMASTDTSWTRVAEEDGILIESQPVAGSAFERLRLTTVVEAPADVVMNALWGDGSLGKDEAVSSREVLRDTQNERITYETAAAPLISTRDFVLRTVRTVEPSGTQVLVFRSIEHPGRPPVDGLVRITRIDGSTTITPIAGRAACTVVNLTFSDPGGAIPAWIAKQGQRDGAVASIKRLRALSVAQAQKR